MGERKGGTAWVCAWPVSRSWLIRDTWQVIVVMDFWQVLALVHPAKGVAITTVVTAHCCCSREHAPSVSPLSFQEVKNGKSHHSASLFIIFSPFLPPFLPPSLPPPLPAPVPFKQAMVDRWYHYTVPEKLRVCIGTWNVNGGKHIRSVALRKDQSMHDWLLDAPFIAGAVKEFVSHTCA